MPAITYFFLNRTPGGETKNSENINVGEGDWDDSDDDDDDAVTQQLLDGNNPSASWGIVDAPYKMVLCVNTSLGMGKGELQ